MLRAASRWNLLWLALGVAGIALWLGWRACNDPAVRFLPAAGTANWILYPNAPDVSAHRIGAEGVAEATVFRQSFVLSNAPATATLHLRAFNSFGATINGERVPVRPPANWKTRVTTEVAPLLRPGTNLIEVVVTNRAGPPLLWLELHAADRPLVSDATWLTSYGGALWQPARLATEPPEIRAGNPMWSEHRPLESLRRDWRLHAILLALALLGLLVVRRLVLCRVFKPAEWASVALGALILLRIALAIHNAPLLPPFLGFDARHHVAYIHHIQEWHELPRPEAGWETHQPPLFYLAAAIVLEVLGIAARSETGLSLLFLIATAMSIGQTLLVFASLRLLFPDELRRPLLGTAMATLLPAAIDHAHFVTNETFVALLVSGAFYLSLRVLRAVEMKPLWFAAVGACLGAALFTKISALVVAPFVFAALVLRVKAEPERTWSTWLRSVGLALGVCALIAGWHYWRIVSEIGNPFSNNSRWGYGSGWWQEDGFRTAAFYLRFGQSLVAPFYSGFHSFWDGLYSTLWGDALVSGSTTASLLIWNDSLVAAGYLLSLAPTAVLIFGLIVATGDLLRRPTIAWLLMSAPLVFFTFAMIYFSLMAPGPSQVRASFGLMLIVPFCAVFALGAGDLVRFKPWLQTFVGAVLLWWALISFAAHWIPAASAEAQFYRAKEALQRGNFDRAAAIAEEGLRLNPRQSMLRGILADGWRQLGRTNEAAQLIADAVVRWPEDPVAHLDRAFDLAQANELELALEHARRAVELAPDDVSATRELTRLLARAGRLDGALAAARDALRVRPHDAELRGWFAHLEQGRRPPDLEPEPRRFLPN